MTRALGTLAVIAALAVPASAHGQGAPLAPEGALPLDDGPAPPAPAVLRDLRLVHEVAVRSLVNLTVGRAAGTGWVVQLGGRSLIVTNRHVVAIEGRPPERSLGQLVDLRYYRVDQVHRGRVRMIARDIDLAVIVPDALPPVPPLTFADRTVVRGERVVLAGHPGSRDQRVAGLQLMFVTTEGVIAGGVSHLPGTQRGTCGTRRSCLLIDAETEPGSSGGPVVNDEGEVIGMVWGSWPGTSLTLAIHAHVLAMALRRVEELATASP